MKHWVIECDHLVHEGFESTVSLFLHHQPCQFFLSQIDFLVMTIKDLLENNSVQLAFSVGLMLSQT